MFNIATLLFLSLSLFLMVWMLSCTQRTANEAATYVHDIWNTFTLAEQINKRTRHLQLISVRLLSTKLQFTARDFFKLDWTFCQMMISAVTTYVVILVQLNVRP
ncbi:unnamed protein product [Tenebrio molitor]|nr:unnamed protein product [Tenebrio molitor]